VNSQTVGPRHVHGYKLNVAVHEVSDKRDVAGEPVKPGDNQHAAAWPALVQRAGKRRAVGMPASALDLGELGGKLAAISMS